MIAVLALVAAPSARGEDAKPLAPVASPALLERSLSIRVRGADGSEVPRCHVRVSWASDATFDATAVETIAGVALVRLPRVPCYVFGSNARKADGSPLPWGPASRTVEADVSAAELRLPAGLEIAGTAVDTEGRPVAHVRLAASLARPVESPGAALRLPLPRGMPTADREQDAHGVTVTAEDGTFRVGGLAAMRYRVAPLVGGDWAASDEYEAEAGSSALRVVLERMVGATVAVVGPDGAPVADASIGVAVASVPWWRRFWLARATTDAGGTARLRGVPAQRELVIEVFPRSNRETLLPIDGQPWSPSVATVRLEPARVIEGTVRGPCGPVAAARIVWRAADGRMGHSQSDSEGRFRLRWVPIVAVEVEASASGVAAFHGFADVVWTTKATVPPDARSVDLRLGPDPK